MREDDAMRKKPYKPTWRDFYEANTIYTKPPHRYGYLININHPEVAPYYRAYKKEIGNPQFFPISDAERFEFEHLVLCGHYPIKLKRA